MSVWRTTSPSESITLPYFAGGTYSGTIDWGDTTTSVNSYANRTHTYVFSGDYTVTIYGVLTGWGFNNGGDKFKIREILRWGPWKNSTGSIFDGVGAFKGCANLTLNNVVDTPTPYVGQKFFEMFRACSSITTINNLNSWDVSKVQNVGAGSDGYRNMFNDCALFNQDISNWNVSNGLLFTSMFYGCLLFNNGLPPGVSGSGLNNWNMSAATNTDGMFAICQSFNQSVSSWDVSNVTSMVSMFIDCRLFNQPLSNWERTTIGNTSTLGNVTDMTQMFLTASIFNQNIGNWDVSSVQNMSTMFNSAFAFNNGGSPDINNWDGSSVQNMSFMFNKGGEATPMTFNQNIGNWDVSNVTTMASMFRQNVSFNNGGSTDINNWDVSSVINMSSMFESSTSFNQPIGSWNVSGVTNFGNMFFNATSFNNGGSSSISGWTINTTTPPVLINGMFWQSTSFNQPIGSWNVSGVTLMNSMFTNATAFNQNLGNWDVTKVTNFNSMFSNAIVFNNGGSPSISGWTINTTAPVQMAAMFATAYQFNQPIGSWDVSRVTTMAQMFYQATLFNQPLSGWNVSNVTLMFQMFQSTPFNQDIGNWNISGVTLFGSFMAGKTPLTFSATNLDSIYNGWSTKNPKTGITINFGSANYTTSISGAGKAILTGSTGSGGYGWTITDGGGI